MNFSTDFRDIDAMVNAVDPVDYGKTRNFVDGSVTRLSPYISRGVISTRKVMDHTMNLGHPFYKIEKFIQELAWRDYWQQIWLVKGDNINQDLKQPQENVANHEMPLSIDAAHTGIIAIDDAIRQFFDSGYLHNHVRMYIASLACNLGKSHWQVPAKWMYYHLLDGDWASNALSWQWVAGANSGKKYFANQQNVNKYCYSSQSGSFLDVGYAEFDGVKVPQELSETFLPDFKTPLPSRRPIMLQSNKPTLIYNYYNVDPQWRSEFDANKVLLLEPSIFEKYPISKKCIDFVISLAKNIDGIQVYVGEFDELMMEIKGSPVYFKEHPLNLAYKGNEDPREWMFSIRGHFPSFFSFWKKCKKELS